MRFSGTTIAGVKSLARRVAVGLTAGLAARMTTVVVTAAPAATAFLAIVATPAVAQQAVRVAIAPATQSTVPGSGQGTGSVVRPSAAALSAAAQEPTSAADRRFTVAIASEPINSQSNSLLPSLGQSKGLSAALGTSVRVVTMKSLREIARAAWAGELDAGWLPANLGVNLLSKGYVLLGADGKSTQMVLLARERIREPKDLIGRTMYLPQEDSLAAYVGIAMLSERSVRLSDFRTIYSIGSYEVAEVAITQGIDDVTVLPEDVAMNWLRANPGKGRVLATSPSVPNQVLVARASLDESTKSKLAAWVANNLVDGGRLQMPSADSLKYVSRIAHYTPDDLAGVTRVTARQAKDLIAKGAVVVDVRSAGEFGAKRIQGAQLVSYSEVSGRVPGGTYADDPFGLHEIGGSKVVFYCNGPECWKSYKASKRALDSKRFEKVFWLRGGLPEWEREGLPITQGAQGSQG